MSSDLSRLFKRAVLKTVVNEGVPAKLGKADGATLFYVDDAGTHHKDKVWARIGAGTAPAEAVVRCVSVPQTLNLPVIVADRDGVLTVIRTDTNRAVEWADGQLIDVAPHNWTHGRYGSDSLYITGLSFLPLAAYPSDPPDLTVTVEQCFYRYQNTHKVFELTISDSLAAYRPAGTTVTHYVILALDRSTNALAVIDGDDVSGGNRALPSASTVLATDGLRSEHFPICAIRLYNAQTQIMPRDIFMDLRLWAGESSASGSGSSGSAAVLGPNTSTDHAIARWDGIAGTLLQDSYPTIDDSGNVDLQGNELRDYSHQMVEANTGAAYEIDWSAAGIFELTLTDDPTFTFSNESAGRAVTLILIQDGTGSRTVTWPGSVIWSGGSAPTLATGAGETDVITLTCQNDGSTVSGFAGGGGAAGAPIDAEYVVMVANATLTDERVLTETAGRIEVTDGGAGAAVTLSPGALIVQTDQGNTYTTGVQTINTGAIGNQALILKMHAGQTENGFEYQDSAGANLIEIDNVGHLGVGRDPAASVDISQVNGVDHLRLTNPTGGTGRIWSFASENGGNFSFIDRTGGRRVYNITSSQYFGVNVTPTERFHVEHASTDNASLRRAILAISETGNDANFTASPLSLSGLSFQSRHTRNGTVFSMAGVDGSVRKTGTGAVTNGYVFHAAIKNEHATGAITTAILYYGAVMTATGAITNAYGLYLENVNLGGTLNYAIYTNAGDVRFGDSVLIDNLTTTKVGLTIKAAAAQTANGFEYQNSAGTPLTYIEADGTVTIDIDSIPVQFGAGQDMDIGYDGTDGYLRTDLVAPSDLNLDCGAAKTIELQAVVYEDLQVSINNLAKGVTAPTDRFYNHGVGAGVAYPVLGFAKNDYVWFDVQTHHAMKLNTVLDNHIHFVLPNTTTIGHKFVFQLDVIAAGIDGTWAVPAGSPFTATHTVAANDDTTHRLLDIADIPASNTTVSSVYKCKLTRIDGVATEYASEVYLEFSDCHYQKNTMGSRQEAAK